MSRGASEDSPEVPWQRLDWRMIVVDAARSVLSLIPTAIAVWIVGVEPRLSALWPTIGVAVVGVGGAVRDVLRWIKTRYRVLDERVELRTGLVVRGYRTVRLDRIRSVDTTARLHHRLAGLRVLRVGAGQAGLTGESALRLDAVSARTAELLRRELLGASESTDSSPIGERLLADLRWSWIAYNVVSVWAFACAAGLLWGSYWITESFGLDAVGLVRNLLDWEALGTGWSIVVGLVAIGVLGMGGMAVAFVTENWNFRLVRAPGENGTVLRTTRGLFHTREVNRDDSRLRGVEISEPVLWRWMGMADTNVITTGLSILSLNPTTTVLPRGPVEVARSVAGAVLDEHPSPFTVPLHRHPRSALRRRFGWAAAVSGVAAVVLAWISSTVDVVPDTSWLIGILLLPLGAGVAVVSYRALGHVVANSYLVVRSGFVSRATAALRRDAVIGWHLRQSVLQRRLGLATVVATTAAGNGQYAAVDIAAADVVPLAESAAPGLLTEFLVDSPHR